MICCLSWVWSVSFYKNSSYLSIYNLFYISSLSVCYTQHTQCGIFGIFSVLSLSKDLHSLFFLFFFWRDWKWRDIYSIYILYIKYIYILYISSKVTSMADLDSIPRVGHILGIRDGCHMQRTRIQPPPLRASPSPTPLGPLHTPLTICFFQSGASPHMHPSFARIVCICGVFMVLFI